MVFSCSTWQQYTFSGLQATSTSIRSFALFAQTISCCHGVAHLQPTYDFDAGTSFLALRDQVCWDCKAPHVSAYMRFSFIDCTAMVHFADIIRIIVVALYLTEAVVCPTEVTLSHVENVSFCCTSGKWR